MTQRRLDGVTPKPFINKTEPTCSDCGQTSVEAYNRGARTWPDGRLLRKYGDEYGCHPCSNGESELIRGGTREDDKPVPGADQFIRDLTFPNYKVEPQQNVDQHYDCTVEGPRTGGLLAKVAPYMQCGQECKFPITGRISCARPNVGNIRIDESDYQRIARALLEMIKNRLPVRVGSTRSMSSEHGA